MDKIENQSRFIPNIQPDSGTAEKGGIAAPGQSAKTPATQSIPIDVIHQFKETADGLNQMLGLQQIPAAPERSPHAVSLSEADRSKLETSLQSKLLSNRIGEGLESKAAQKGQPDGGPARQGSGEGAVGFTSNKIRASDPHPAGPSLQNQTIGEKLGGGAGSAAESAGKLELDFDEARLASLVDPGKLLAGAAKGGDGQPDAVRNSGGKNPLLPGSRKGASSPGQDRVHNPEKGALEAVQAGLSPGGPDTSAKVNQLLQGNLTVAGRQPGAEAGIEGPRSGSEKEQREKLRAGASGSALLDAASKDVQTGPTYGSEMLAGGFEWEGPKTVTNNRDGTTTHSMEHVYSDGDKLKTVSQSWTYDDGELVGTKRTITVFDNKTGTKVVKQEETKGRFQFETTTTTNPDGSTTTNQKTVVKNSDGSTTTTEKTTKNPAPAEDPGDLENYSGDVPEAIQKQMGNFLKAFRAAGPHKGGEEVNPSPESSARGPAVDDPQVHLGEMGARGLIGQPDTTQPAGGGGAGLTGSSQSGGDVDFGPDSAQQGYTGTSRTEDPGDVRFAPGGSALKPSSDDDKQKEAAADSSAKKDPGFRFRS